MVDAALIDLEVERLMTVNFIRNHPTTASFLRGGTSRRNAVCMDLLKYHLGQSRPNGAAASLLNFQLDCCVYILCLPLCHVLFFFLINFVIPFEWRDSQGQSPAKQRLLRWPCSLPSDRAILVLWQI